MSDACAIVTCVRPSRSLGYCSAHWQRLRKGSDMSSPLRTIGDDYTRFWEKVRKTEGCWTWIASTNGDGYGKFYLHGSPQRAHRVSYAWAYGQIPESTEIDHACHNRACVNPDHLRPATSSLNGQNLQGAYSNSRSGVRGVSWYKTRGTWRAEARVGGKRYFLGYYDDLEEATAVVTEWRRINMPYSLMDQKKE